MMKIVVLVKLKIRVGIWSINLLIGSCFFYVMKVLNLLILRWLSEFVCDCVLIDFDYIVLIIIYMLWFMLYYYIYDYFDYIYFIKFISMLVCKKDMNIKSKDLGRYFGFFLNIY